MYRRRLVLGIDGEHADILGRHRHLRHALLARANGHTHLLGVQPLGRRHTLLKRATGERQPDGIPRQRRRHISRQRTRLSDQRDRDSRQGLNTRLRRADIAGEPRQDSTAVGGQYRLHARKRCSAEGKPKGIFVGCRHYRNARDTPRHNNLSRRQASNHSAGAPRRLRGHTNRSTGLDNILRTTCRNGHLRKAHCRRNGRKECHIPRRPYRQDVRLPAL